MHVNVKFNIHETYILKQIHVLQSFESILDKINILSHLSDFFRQQ